MLLYNDVQHPNARRDLIQKKQILEEYVLMCSRADAFKHTAKPWVIDLCIQDRLGSGVTRPEPGRFWGVRSCLAVKSDAVHICTEIVFIFQEILRASRMPVH
jgi:hypothetical protein